VILDRPGQRCDPVFDGGELELDGSVRPVQAMLPAAILRGEKDSI
jgi:hypothetical protein